MNEFTLLTEQQSSDRFHRKVEVLKTLLRGKDIEVAVAVTVDSKGEIAQVSVRHIPTGATVKTCVMSEWRFPDRLLPRILRSPVHEARQQAFQVKEALGREIQDELGRQKLRAMRSLAQALFAAG